MFAKKVTKKTLGMVDNALHMFKNTPNIVQLDIPYHTAPYGSCGLACVDMCIGYYGGKERTATRGELLQEGYDDTRGWKHTTLAELITEHTPHVAKTFRFRSHRFIQHHLAQQHPVIVSLAVPTTTDLDTKGLYQPTDPTKNLEHGHLCVCTGYTNDSIILHDPRNNGPYAKHTKIPLVRFKQIFTGRGVV
jgi:hypothetical protein